MHCVPVSKRGALKKLQPRHRLETICPQTAETDSILRNRSTGVKPDGNLFSRTQERSVTGFLPGSLLHMLIQELHDAVVGRRSIEFPTAMSGTFDDDQLHGHLRFLECGVE